MSRSRRWLALLGGALGFCASASAASDAAGLRLAAAGPAWTGGTATVRVVPLAQTPSARVVVLLYAEDRLLASATVPAAGGTVTFSTRGLAAGPQELWAKAGTAQGRATLRILPRGFGPAASFGLVALLAAAARLSQRTRRD